MDDDLRSDHELLRCSRRDPDAFAALAGRYLPLLRAWAHGQTRSLEAANDVAAEALARGWLQRRRYRGGGDPAARGWLFGIARNVLRESWRRDRVEARACSRLGVERPGVADETAAIEARLAAAADAGDLTRALDDLPLGHRDAIELHVIGGLPYGAAAEQLGCSEAAARLRVSRGLARARAHLSDLKDRRDEETTRWR